MMPEAFQKAECLGLRTAERQGVRVGRWKVLAGVGVAEAKDR